jgi:cation diffusion facilitator family transporter
MSRTQAQKNRRKKQIQQLTLGLAITLLVIKLIAWWITGSNVILGDALESIVNVLAAFFGLYSLWLAAQPKDENHPYGHGKIEFIAAAIEGALILLSGVFIFGRGIWAIWHLQPLERLEDGTILLGLTGLVNYVLGRWIIKQGRIENSAVLKSSGIHLLSDAYTTAGMILGLALTYLTGWVILDAIAAMVFAVMIGWHGWQIIRNSVSGIMDEADTTLLEKLVEHLENDRDPDWIDLHNLRVIKYGHAMHLDAHITMPWYYDLRQSHAVMIRFEQSVDVYFGEKTELFLHVDPCEPTSCSLCSQFDCPARRVEFEKRLVWNLDLAISNQKHSLTPKT